MTLVPIGQDNASFKMIFVTFIFKRKSMARLMWSITITITIAM